MNITDAYRRYMGGHIVRRPQYRGVLQFTYELLEQVLELPPGVHIQGMQPNIMTNSLDIMLWSDTPIEGITYEVRESEMTPNIDMDRYVSYIRIPNGIRPQVGFNAGFNQSIEAAPNPVPIDWTVITNRPAPAPSIPYPDPFEF